MQLLRQEDPHRKRNGRVQWGYFSEKDGESHSFDLCEACYDKLTAGFKIPPEKNTEKELL